MKIAGLQKLSLVDYPGCSCATIFTSGCNMRCPFCHNSQIAFAGCLHNEDLINIVEVIDFLCQRKNMLDGVCISGGEPTLQREGRDNLVEFVSVVKRMGFKVKLDTNGSSPEILKTLIELNLIDYVAMDVKSSLQDYGKAIGIAKPSQILLDNIKESIKILLENKVDYEFRTTIVNELHNFKNLSELAGTIKDAKLWRLQRFEQSDNVPDPNLTDIKAEKLKLMIENIEIKPKEIIFYS